MADRLQELLLCDTIQTGCVHVVEKFVDILDARLDLHGLDALNEFFLVKRGRNRAYIATEDFEKALKGDLILILDGQDLGASRGEDRVNEAALQEGHVDAATRHEVDEVLVRDFELAFVSHAHIFDYALGLLLREDNLEASKVFRHTISGHVLVGCDIDLLLAMFSLWLLVIIEDLFKRHVLVLQFLLDLLV